MADAVRKNRGVGRPSRDRTRHLYVPKLEVVSSLRLDALAERAGISSGMVAEIAIGHAHGYQSPWTSSIDVLGGVDADALVHVVQTMPSEPYCHAGAYRRCHVRLDGVLADQVNNRCDELDVVYAHYLRRILHQLVDFDFATLHGDYVVQDELFDARGAAS